MTQSGKSMASWVWRAQYGRSISSAGKETTCNAGDPSSVPRLGRSPGERISCLLQYSWVSLVVLMVKNPPAMQETCIRFLGWKVPLRRAWQPTSLFLPGDVHEQRSLVGYSPWDWRVRYDWSDLAQQIVSIWDRERANALSWTDGHLLSASLVSSPFAAISGPYFYFEIHSCSLSFLWPRVGPCSWDWSLSQWL